jgi:uncharacterized membrane protein
MTALILGLVLFLGIHSARIVADGTRSTFIAERGANAWKGLYSVVSLVGLVLIVWGYGQARQQPVVLWASPAWTRHLAALLTWPAFVLLAAPSFRANWFSAKWHHPMTLGAKLWAFAHLVANNTLADVLLFGGFLAWAIVLFAAARRRDRRAGTVYPAPVVSQTVKAVVAGTVVWLVFAFWLHGWLIGVQPFGSR